MVWLLSEGVEKPEETAGEQRCYRQRENPGQGNVAQRGHLQAAPVRSHCSGYT